MNIDSIIANILQNIHILYERNRILWEIKDEIDKIGISKKSTEVKNDHMRLFDKYKAQCDFECNLEKSAKINLKKEFGRYLNQFVDNEAVINKKIGEIVDYYNGNDSEEKKCIKQILIEKVGDKITVDIVFPKQRTVMALFWTKIMIKLFDKIDGLFNCFMFEMSEKMKYIKTDFSPSYKEETAQAYMALYFCILGEMVKFDEIWSWVDNALAQDNKFTSIFPFFVIFLETVAFKTMKNNEGKFKGVIDGVKKKRDDLEKSLLARDKTNFDATYNEYKNNVWKDPLLPKLDVPEGVPKGVAKVLPKVEPKPGTTLKKEDLTNWGCNMYLNIYDPKDKSTKLVPKVILTQESVMNNICLVSSNNYLIKIFNVSNENINNLYKNEITNYEFLNKANIRFVPKLNGHFYTGGLLNDTKVSFGVLLINNTKPYNIINWEDIFKTTKNTQNTLTAIYDKFHELTKHHFVYVPINDDIGINKFINFEKSHIVDEKDWDNNFHPYITNLVFNYKMITSLTPSCPEIFLKVLKIKVENSIGDLKKFVETYKEQLEQYLDKYDVDWLSFNLQKCDDVGKEYKNVSKLLNESKAFSLDNQNKASEFIKNMKEPTELFQNTFFTLSQKYDKIYTNLIEQFCEKYPDDNLCKEVEEETE